MYGLQEALSRERCADLRRWSAQRRLHQQDAVARRWRHRRGAQSSGAARDARRDYELAGR